MSLLGSGSDPEGEQPEHWPTTVSMNHHKNSSGLSRLHPRVMTRRLRLHPSSRLMTPSSLAAYRALHNGSDDDCQFIRHDSKYRSSTRHRNEVTSFTFDIPPELFGHILFFVNHPQPVIIRHTPSTRTRLLKKCALVCRHWANRCRRYLFHGATLEIRSYQSLESLFRYALHGCPSLVPIHTLISGINVVQTYNEPSSFLHRAFSFKCIAGTQVQLFHLEISGPIPSNFSTCKLDTPHWSLPASIPTPPSLVPYNCISLTTIHLPSFGHVVKYISHFKLATRVDLHDLTWDDDGPQELPSSFVRGPPRRIPHEDFTLNISRCTDNGRIALQAISTYKHFPLYLLSDGLDRERHAIIMWINALFKHTTEFEFLRVNTTWTRSTIDVKIAFAINQRSLICLTMHDYGSGESQDTKTSDFHIRSFYARNLSPVTRKDERLEYKEIIPPARMSWLSFDEFDDSPRDTTCWTGELNHPLSSASRHSVLDFIPNPGLDDLQTYLGRYLEQFSMLGAIAIAFDNYDQLLSYMETRRPISFNPLIAHNKYVIVFERTDDDQFPEVARPSGHLRGRPDWVGINPSTLTPTGQVWNNEDDIIPSLLSIPIP